MSTNKAHSLSYALMLIFEVGIDEIVINQTIFAKPQEAIELEKHVITGFYIPRSLSENRNRREGKFCWVSLFVHLRRIVALFNENERGKWPKGLFCSRFSILGQTPRPGINSITPVVVIDRQDE